MKEIELYDIITLTDDSEYTVLKKTTYQGNDYFLLAPVDEEENPDMENIKIVKVTTENGNLLVDEEENEENLKNLSKIFLNSLRETLE